MTTEAATPTPSQNDAAPDAHATPARPATLPPLAPCRHQAHAADALIQFDTRPASSFVRLPVVCSLYACSPATAWRWVKAGKIPLP